MPGNVTEEKYRVRLGFVRRVAMLHFGSILVVGALSMLRLPEAPLEATGALLAGLLLVLALLRIGTRATRYDLLFSSTLLPPLLLSLAAVVRTLNRAGWPVWGIAVGVGAAVVYALSCGRDFSFVGQYLLALIGSSVLIAVAAITFGYDPHAAAVLLGGNALYLFYYVYDLASLLARRRLGEEAAAVVDLYRDVYNVFGYIFRVARHWKKHRIWAK